MSDDLDPTAVERAARAIRDKGAWCGICDGPDDDACRDCAEVCTAYARAALAAARDGASCGARYCTTDDVLGPHQHRAGRTVLASAAPTVTTEQVRDIIERVLDLNRPHLRNGAYPDWLASAIAGRVNHALGVPMDAARSAAGIEVREP